jgi:probable rRNA maturation factor
MEINVLIDEDFEAHLEAGWLEAVARQVLAAEAVSPDAELSLVITGQERVQQLNRDDLGRDRPTDVLAFSMLAGLPAEGEADTLPFVAPPDGVLHLGEVIIAYPQAVIQAEEHRHPVTKEVALLVIHGILHLLGYDDEKPEAKRRMRAREKEILGSIEVG